MFNDFSWDLFVIIRQARDWINGRDITKHYEAKFGKHPSARRLYSTLRKLNKAGLIETRDAKDEGGRVRYFRVTKQGAGKYVPVKRKGERKRSSRVPAPVAA